MGFIARLYYEIECDHEDCGLIEDVLLSNREEAIEELKDDGWVFHETKNADRFQNKTYCSHKCKKEATS